MKYKLNDKSPVVVGGVGGSGTRLIADILMSIGYHMGFDLNASQDNLGFTLLFKRPQWYQTKMGCMEGYVRRGLGIFSRAMTQPQPLWLDPAEMQFFLNAVFSMYRHGHDHLGSGKGTWSLQRAANLLGPKLRDPGSYCGWGWKEPNSHIYLQWLDRCYPGLKYVHVIRNGLDMAYSANQAQLYNWGFIWGIDRNRIDREPAAASLDFWIHANHHVMRIGQTMGTRRFMLLNYDSLCENPQAELSALFGFLGVDTAGNSFKNNIAKIKPPESIGRYRKFNSGVFAETQLEQVREMGFHIF